VAVRPRHREREGVSRVATASRTLVSTEAAPRAGRRSAPVRVFVVEDHPLLRSVIKVACDQTPSLVWVGEAEDGESAFEACRTAHPDVMVLDLSLAGELQGLELARRIREEGLSIKILVVTARTDETAVFESLIAGVDGFLEKTAGVRSMAEALERLANGERLFTTAQMQGAVAELGRRARQARDPGTATGLTAREREVLGHAAQGLTVGQMARRLHLSPRTVETHLARAYRRLGVRNRVQALARASDLGLIEIA
jgi:DNA-binding NarL/FixJ family response regulator